MPLDQSASATQCGLILRFYVNATNPFAGGRVNDGDGAADAIRPGHHAHETFGRRHGILVVDTFYENVEGPDGENHVLQFTPRDREPMLVACLWSAWSDPKGVEPDLLSFAAITDEPEPEVAAAGHDRTIINIKPEHVDAWLNPDPNNLAALYAIFDDKRHPFYEHRLAA